MADESGDQVDLSYSYRETPAQIWANRVGVTGMLFAVAMTLSWWLGGGRRRR